MNDSTVRPFSINVSDDILVDLHRRLDATRWPEAEPVDDWSQGVPLSWLEDMCRYWRHDYDWRAREAALNRFELRRIERITCGAAIFSFSQKISIWVY